MGILEGLGWWTLQGLLLFAVIGALSKVPAIPALVKKFLWLAFLIKLVIPVGFIHSVDPTEWGGTSVPSGLVQAPTHGNPEFKVGETGASQASETLTRGAKSSEPLSWEWIVLVVWSLGTAVTAGLMMVAYRRESSHPNPGPSAVGIFRPRIRLPSGFEHDFDPTERAMILAHENAHLRFLDPLWLLLVQMVTAIVWWFVPVWFARRGFVEAMEEVCDRSVVEGIPKAETQKYGLLLVRLARSRRPRTLVVSALGGYRGLQRRIQALVRPTRVRGPMAGVLALAVTLGVGAFSLTPPESRWCLPIATGDAIVSGLAAHRDYPGFSGIVIEVAEGTALVAVADGTTGLSTWSPEMGWEMSIDHGDGWISRYGNLAVDLEIVKGTHVVRGQTIGKISIASAATALNVPSLYFSLSKDGKSVDPSTVLPNLSLWPVSSFGARGLVWPLPAGIGAVTQEFGWNIHAFTGQRFFHKGADWAAPNGTPVMAIADGVVDEANYEALGMGHFVRIDHGSRRWSLYGHLSRDSTLAKGTFVKAGDVIGLSGATGLATGPVLHWEINVGGFPMDPLGFRYTPPSSP